MGAKEAFARERAAINADHVKRARKLIAADALQETGLEISDTECQGLVLRVRRRTGKWLLKTRARTVTLGDMDTLTPTAARIAVKEVWAASQRGMTRKEVKFELGVFANVLGRDVRYPDGFMRKATPQRALGVAFPRPAPDDVPEPTDEQRRLKGPWEWRDLVDIYLETKLPTLKPRWATQYEKHLRRSLGHDFDRARVWSVDLEKLIKLRDDLAETCAPSAVADTIEAIQGALNWAWTHHSTRSGLQDVEFPWWREKLTVEWSSGTREHTPTMAELARTLVLAEQHRALGGTAKKTDNGTLAALWAIVLTGQRIGALTGTRRATVREWPERPGWKIWTWTAQEMKAPGGGRAKKRRPPKPHGLPIPPEALAVLERFPVDRSSKYLFPNRDNPAKPVTPSALTGLMSRLKGKSKGAKKGGVTLRPEGDLLTQHEIRHWTVHDIRRTLPTFLDLERMGGAGSSILAHTRRKASGDADEERELASAITLRHYIHSQRMELKADGMAVWVKALLNAYETEKALLEA